MRLGSFVLVLGFLLTGCASTEPNLLDSFSAVVVTKDLRYKVNGVFRSKKYILDEINRSKITELDVVIDLDAESRKVHLDEFMYYAPAILKACELVWDISFVDIVYTNLQKRGSADCSSVK